MKQSRTIRFRRWPSVVVACVVATFFGVLFFGIGGGGAKSGEISGDSVAAFFLVPPFVTVVIWFFFKLCIFSGVDVSEDRVTVRNFSTEIDIGINLIDSVKWVGGVYLVLKNGTKIKSIAFPDSLFSFALQYRNFRRVARLMDAKIKERSHDFAVVDFNEVRQRKQRSLPLLFAIGLSCYSLLFVSYFIFS